MTKTLRLGSGGVHDASQTALEHDRTMESNGSIAAPNERVPVDELEKSVIAEAESFRELAARKEQLR